MSSNSIAIYRNLLRRYILPKINNLNSKKKKYKLFSLVK